MRIEEFKIQQLEAKLTRKRKYEVLFELLKEKLKKNLGISTGRWVSHDIRDAVVDYVNDWSDKAKIPVKRFYFP